MAIPGYRVAEPLGHGGVGTVWHAQRLTDDASVAIKISHGHDVITRQRFEREADALERIGPPFVPERYAHGVLHDGRHYLVMERLDGQPLDTVLATLRGPPPHPWIKRVSDGLIACLAAAHRHRIVHRDLKPENIFLEGSGHLLTPTGVGRDVGRIVLLDLGLVRIVRSHDDLTRTGVVVGTLEYMAPEQLSGRRSIDARVDLYAFGAVLYELFALRPPFVRDPGYIEYAHQAIRPPPPSRFAPIPGAVEDVILRCLAKDPEDRHDDVDALRRALDAAWRTARGESRAPSDVRPDRDRRPAAQKRRKLTGVAAFVSGIDNVAALRTTLELYGGVLGHVGQGRVACVFTSEVSQHPVRRAWRAANHLMADQIIDCAVLDLIPMTARTSALGKSRFRSLAFKDDSRYPAAGDPRGRVLLTKSAREHLPDIEIEPGGPERSRVVVAQDNDQAEPSVTGATALWFQPRRLIGHEALIDAMKASVHEVISDEQATLVTLIGDIGMGKSHLCNVLVRELCESHSGDAEIIALHPGEPVAGVQDATARRLLGHLLQLPELSTTGLSPVSMNGRDTSSAGDPLDGATPRTLASEGKALLTEALGETIATEVYESVGALLGWLSPDAPEVMRLRAAPGTLRANAARAIAEGLGQKARERPLCVIVDDTQWADDITLDALEQATSREGRLWVCALARPQLIGARSNWGQRAVRAEHRVLEPLTGEHAAALCRRLLRPAEIIPESVIMRLVNRSRGVPLLLVELVRALEKQGLVRRHDDTGPWQIASEVLEAIPDTPIVEWLATRELDSLSDNLSAHARLVALLGPEFGAEEVDGVLREMERADNAGDVPLDARVGLDMLRSSGLLVHMAVKQTFRFSHGMLRQGVAASATESFRQRVHRAAYRYYRDDPRPMNRTERRARLAHHAARAGEREHAGAAYLELAREAQERHAYLDADLFYHRALGQLDSGAVAERQRALHGRGVVRWRLTRYQDALIDLSRARELAHQRGDISAEIRLLLEEATVLDWIDEWRRSKELAELARDRAATVADPVLDAWITMSLGRSACRFNDNQAAIALLLEAADRAGELGDAGYETEVISLMLAGGLLAAEGRLDESHDAFERGIPRCVERRDDLHRISMLNCRAYLWIARGDMARLVADLEDVRATARRLGNATLERHAAINQAWYRHWAGDHEKAEFLALRAARLDDQRLRDDTRRPEAEVLMARLRWAQHDETGCRALVDEILRHQDRARQRDHAEALLVPSEQVMFDMIKLALDDPGQDAWNELIEQARERCQMEPEIVEVLQISAVTAQRRGDTQAARSALQSALAMADKLPETLVGRIREQLDDLGGSGG